MIRYLTMEEKPESRSLWEEAFPEDSRQFDDYYYKEKIRDNRILALVEEGQIDAMIHLNPYEVSVGNQTWRLDYLVGVATRKDRRHRGYMRMLLNKMMEDMWEEQVPFCYLMPADEQIYRPFDFAFIYDQPQWELTQQQKLTRKPLLPWKDSIAAGRYLKEIAGWINEWLEAEYQVYARRDESYLRRLLEEIASEGGTFDLLYDQDKLVGMESLWGWGKQEQRMLLATPEYRQTRQPKKPAIMARIICLTAMARVIHLTRQGAEAKEEYILTLQVSDPLIPGNDGLWKWRINGETSWMEPIEDSGIKPDLSLSIGDLTQWLFGYHMPKEAEPYEGIVEPLHGVYLDEIV